MCVYVRRVYRSMCRTVRVVWCLGDVYVRVVVAVVVVVVVVVRCACCRCSLNYRDFL